MSDLTALAARSLSFVSPGIEAQATVVRERSLSARFARSAPTQTTSVEDVSVELTAVVDGHVGAASTNRLDDASLAACAGRAAAAAVALASSGEGTYPGLAPPADDGDVSRFDVAARRQIETRPDVAGEALAECFAAADSHGLEAFGLWTAGTVTTALATTGGLAAVDEVADAHVHLMVRDAGGQSGYATTTGVSPDEIDAAELTHRAASKVTGEPPRSLAPGEYTVVLEPEAVGTLVDFLAMCAFNGLAHVEGRGALAGRMGEPVAAPSITLFDDPRQGIARAFDPEGTPKVPVSLITGGVAEAVVHDRRSAALAAAAGDPAVSTGHAWRPGGDPEGPHPTNLVLAAGDLASTGELIAGVERGIYVTRFWYVNIVDPKRALLTGMSRDGTFLIEDGRLGPRIHDVRFTDSALRLLEATDALSAEQRLVSEGEFYGARFAFGHVCPALRAHGFRVTGTTTG